MTGQYGQSNTFNTHFSIMSLMFYFMNIFSHNYQVFFPSKNMDFTKLYFVFFVQVRVTIMGNSEVQ